VIDRTYSEDKVRELEKIYITEYNSYNKGYNSNLGGNGHLKFPESIRKKISEAQIGKIVSEDTKRKMSLAKTGDKRCAKNFGKHTQKGAKNPRAKSYLIRFPDGSEHMVSGLLAFCRDHKLTRYKLTKNGKTKGYELLSRFND
jgi:hypothetical protein